MKRTWLTSGFGMLLLCAFIAFGQGSTTVQQTSQTEQRQEAQGDQQVNQALEELEEIHERLGQLIDELRQDMTARQQLEERVSRLERLFRETTAQQARRELERLRTDIEAGESPERTAAEIRRIRSGLEQAYASTSDMDIDQEVLGRELTTSFEALVNQVTEGSEEAAATLDELVGQFDEQLAPPPASEAQETQQEQPEEQQEEQPEEEAEAEEEAVTPEEFQWEEVGQQVYAANCAACHQPDGQGLPGAFPPLANNPFVTGDPGPVIRTVLHGRGGMPSFSGLSDEQIAAVISHERNSWENEASVITPDMVATIRAGEQLQDQPTDPSERPGAAN